MPPGAHKSKTITFHYVLRTFLYVPRQPLFLEGGFLGTFRARCFLLRSRALLYGCGVRGFIRATGQRDCFLPITSMQCSLSTHVPTTFLHVPPWLSKRFVDISYVPIRSEQPSRSFRKTCTQIIRYYMFCAAPPTNSKKDVLKSYVPIRSEQSSRSSRLICYVPTLRLRSFTFYQ